MEGDCSFGHLRVARAAPSADLEGVPTPGVMPLPRVDVDDGNAMYETCNLDDLETIDVDDVEPGLKAVGYELRPEKMRPSLWIFEPGESNNRHRQREQEELYLVLDGRLEMTVDDETFEVVAGDVVVVPPESWRQLTAVEESRVFAVGAPNVKDDDVREGEE